MIEGCPHGKGERIHPNKDKYSGNFKYGKMEGWGKYEYANGNVYEG